MRHTLNRLRFLAIFILLMHGSGIYFNTLSSERVRWKLQISNGGTEEPVKQLIERVKTMSSGKIQLRFYKINTLVPGLELHSAVGEGQLDAGFSVTAYFARKIPAVIFFGGVPFGPRLVEHKAWMLYGGGQQLKDRIYEDNGLISLECGIETAEVGGWFKKRYTRVADLKGTRMRTFGLGGDVLKKFGVTTTLLDPFDIVPAVKKGVIDAAEFGSPFWDHFLGFHKVFKYSYYPSWNQPYNVHELIINKQQWEKLDETAKLIFRTSCDSSLVSWLVRLDSMQPDSMRQFEQEGVEFLKWQESELKKLRKAWHEVAEEESAKDPLFAEVYKSYKSFRDQYAIWGERAYLK